MSGARAVIFDFDFTVVDSSRGFIACHEFAAGECGLPAPQHSPILRTIGTPLPLAFVDLYGPGHATLVEEYVRVYQAKADEVMTAMTSVLPGVPAVLTALKGESLGLAIVSQKLRRRIEDVLVHEDLLACFDVIVGGEDLTHLKPDPEGLRLALGRLGVNDAVYVGDTVIDAEAAKRAGLPFVAVLTGVTRRQEFEGWQSAAILDDLETLPDLCRSWCWPGR